MVLNIRVLTPDRVICSTTADEVILPGLTGQVGVLNGHATLITALDTGLLRIKLNDKWTPIILCGGLAEIDRNRVTVLVNDVEELISVKLSEATKELQNEKLCIHFPGIDDVVISVLQGLRKYCFGWCHGSIKFIIKD